MNLTNSKNGRILPNLIIAGATKSATSSLYTYLSWHPDICVSKIKETNFFLRTTESKSDLDGYSSHFEHCSGDRYKIIMEASPLYVYGGRKIARALSECLGLIKIVFILRDPIDRLHSWYKHIKGTRLSREDICFEDFARRGLIDFKNVSPRNSERIIDISSNNVCLMGIEQGIYVDFLDQWYSVFGDNVKVCFFEHLTNKPLLFMTELCDWLGLDSSIYLSRTFSAENRSVIPRSKFVRQIAERINTKFEKNLRRHYKTKKYLRSFYRFINATNEKEEFRFGKMFKLLESAYDHHNSRLYKLLREKGYSKFPHWLSKYDFHFYLNAK